METIRANFAYQTGENLMGETRKDTMRLHSCRRLLLEFYGTTVTSDTGLLAYREHDERLQLSTREDRTANCRARNPPEIMNIRARGTSKNDQDVGFATDAEFSTRANRQGGWNGAGYSGRIRRIAVKYSHGGRTNIRGQPGAIPNKHIMSSYAKRKE